MRRARAAAPDRSPLLAGCGSDEPTPRRGRADDQLARARRHASTTTARAARPPRELELDCDAPTDSQACGAAAGVSAADLAPTPARHRLHAALRRPGDATIKGTIRGEDVDATFSRSDGCEIERWESVEPLLAEVQ